jgi:hypothetical protein
MKKKIGQNDPCFCGSGLKHKKCCKQNENLSYPNALKKEFYEILKYNGIETDIIVDIFRGSIQRSSIDINLDELKILLSSSGDYKKIETVNGEIYPEIDLVFPMTLLTSSIELYDRKTEEYEGVLAKNNVILEDKKFIGNLGWAKRQDRNNEYLKILKQTISKGVKPYELKLLSYPALPGYISKAIWNETDQGVLRYKGHLYNILVNRIESIYANFEDILTLACIVRQLVEIMINAVFNFWVILVAYGNLQNAVDQLSQNIVVIDEFFPNYVQTLSDWPKGALNKLNNNIRNSIAMHRRSEYSPPQLNRKVLTYDERLKCAKNTIKGADKQKQLKTGSLSDSLKTLHEQYSFLNGFVHPSAQIFPVVSYYRDSSEGFSDLDVRHSIQISAIKTIYHSLRLFEFYILDDNWDKLGLLEMLSTSKVKDLSTCFITQIDTMKKPEWFI